MRRKRNCGNVNPELDTVCMEDEKHAGLCRQRMPDGELVTWTRHVWKPTPRRPYEPGTTTRDWEREAANEDAKRRDSTWALVLLLVGSLLGSGCGGYRYWGPPPDCGCSTQCNGGNGARR